MNPRIDELSPVWRASLERLSAEQRASRPTADPRGGWTVTIDGSMASASAVVAALPGTWELDDYEEEELIDANGEGIDLEWTSELWIAHGELAVFACVDHWQAGLIGTLTVFAEEPSFTAALVTLRARNERSVWSELG